MTSLRFHDHLVSGFVSFDESDYNEAWLEVGRKADRSCSFDLDIVIPEAERFFADREHTADCTGRIVCDRARRRAAARRGSFNPSWR